MWISLGVDLGSTTMTGTEIGASCTRSTDDESGALLPSSLKPGKTSLSILTFLAAASINAFADHLLGSNIL